MIPSLPLHQATPQAPAEAQEVDYHLLEDDVLLEKALAGDENAWSELEDRHLEDE